MHLSMEFERERRFDIVLGLKMHLKDGFGQRMAVGDKGLTLTS